VVSLLVRKVKVIVMSLYEQIPKEAIISRLRREYSDAELDSIKAELPDLLHQCCGLDELQEKLAVMFQHKRSLNNYRRIHSHEFIGI
jgi:hypothetical protein